MWGGGVLSLIFLQLINNLLPTTCRAASHLLWIGLKLLPTLPFTIRQSTHVSFWQIGHFRSDVFPISLCTWHPHSMYDRPRCSYKGISKAVNFSRQKTSKIAGESRQQCKIRGEFAASCTYYSIPIYTSTIQCKSIVCVYKPISNRFIHNTVNEKHSYS